MRIGLFGGSFDPMHNGHLSLIEGALDSGAVDCVIVIPTVRNSFKRGRVLSAAPYRYYMVKDVVEERFGSSGNVFVSDVEFFIEGISYTVSTVGRISDPAYITDFLVANGVKKKKASEDHSFFWICGTDVLLTFDKWYKPEEILTKAALLVALRPGCETDIEGERQRLSEAFGFEADIRSFASEKVDIASSFIRKEGDLTMIPKAASDFIATHDLYKRPSPLDPVSDKACEFFLEAAISLYPVLGRKRLLHTLNVGILSAYYAQIHGADVDKALIAGVLHDCAKELDIKLQSEMAFRCCGDLMTDPKLLHSPAGAIMAQEKFGITDREILDAITYHTTGRGNMTMLDKIVYLADKLEPSRTYTDLTLMREVALSDLDEAVRMCVKAVRNKFLSQGRDIHPLTCEFMKDLGII